MTRCTQIIKPLGQRSLSNWVAGDMRFAPATPPAVPVPSDFVGTTPVLRGGGGRLEGRGCLLVGGTGGIGLASARRFLQEGARVVVSGVDEASTREAVEGLAP